jgi:ABC-2 type transport system permease protein
MAKLLSLAWKDLRVLMADKGNVFWVFGFPALFALLFGAVYSGTDKGPSGMKLAVVDGDRSELSGSYVSHLESEEALKVVRLTKEEALTGVRKGQFAAAVVIRPGFGDGFGAIFDTNDPKLQIASDPGRKMEAAYLEGLLAKTQFEVLGQRFQDRDWMRSQIGTWRSEVKAVHQLDPNQTGVYMRFFDSLDGFLTDVNDRNYKSRFDESILAVGKLDVERERSGLTNSFQITFPQAIVWGLLSCASTFAVSIVRERTRGTYQRLCIGPISQSHILAGKGLACFFTCALVITMLTLAAKLLFKTPMDSLALFFVAAACASLCFVGIMMFVSTLGKTEQSVGGAGWAILMILAMFGGAMIPLAFMPAWMQGVSHASPVRWAILAMEGAVWRHFTPAEMLVPCVVLIVLATAFFTAGALILRRSRL